MCASRPLLALALPLLLGACALFQPSHNPHVPYPAKSVDLSRYSGLWYEFARYDSSFEHDCVAATAEYAPISATRIRVINTCHKGTPSGRMERVRGQAIIVPHSGNARLRVSFFGPFFIGNYWVLDHADDYSWSIVGEPTGGYLWVLTRTPHPKAAERQALIARVAALGYNTRYLVFPAQ